MTFLLQKFNAINRTRTETRARSGLRSPASGIAFTGRFAACLLLAGFLGVGSAIAQPKVLRMEGGPISVSRTLLDNTTEGFVHNYRIGTANAVANPNNLQGSDGSFLVGALALVTVTGTGGSNPRLVVEPIAPGSFTITLAASWNEAVLGLQTKVITFDIVSVNAPRIIGLDNVNMATDYNGVANGSAAADDGKSPVVLLALADKNTSSKDYTLTDWFTDPNDPVLTYDPKADPVGVVTRTSTIPSGQRSEAIVSATTSGNKLTIALTNKARAGDMTNVWVFARDGNEYARRQVTVTVGSPQNPYVTNKIGDRVLREDDQRNTEIDLSAAGMFFTDLHFGDGAGGVRTAPDAGALTYTISISDRDAEPVPRNPEPGDSFAWVTPYMVATVTLGGKLVDDSGAAIPTTIGAGTAKLDIRPRAPGSAKFKVTATDKGFRCRTGYIYVAGTPEDPLTTAIEYVAPKCEDALPNDPPALADTGLYPDAKSATQEFTVTILSRTSPDLDTRIPNLSGNNALVADGDAKTVDLADVDGRTDGAQAAFKDPTGLGLTYEVSTSKGDSAFVTATVNGSVITLVPVWRVDTGSKTATVMVTATNDLGESRTTSFTVQVKKGTKPMVNPLVEPFLGVGFSMNTGAEALKVDLRNIVKAVPLFIDPDAASNDPLPGGLLHKIRIEDVVADHLYESQSVENNVVTSAMRIQLDPITAILTVTPTAANSAMVTVWGIDRDGNMISATTTFTVVSGVSAEDAELPTEVELSQNYPNPFNPQTTIDYALPQAGDVSLVVYDMLGREVDVLLDGPQAAGRHTVRFGANHLPN
ncbi:MAG: T9SS type A sorting domain-containing protein, partial [Bacteroidetes bacterium SB0662_bin_6]|nr:T9SS type A sorting domain-containing protein [Bacteroidetes bacterium SB0662_bin_6]